MPRVENRSGEDEEGVKVWGFPGPSSVVLRDC